MQLLIYSLHKQCTEKSHSAITVRFVSAASPALDAGMVPRTKRQEVVRAIRAGSVVCWTKGSLIFSSQKQQWDLQQHRLASVTLTS